MMKCSLKTDPPYLIQRCISVFTDRLFIWFFIFVIGAFGGCLASGKLLFESNYFFSSSDILLNLFFVGLSLFLSTSFLGVVLIPLLFFVRAFLYSLSFSFVLVYSQSSSMLSSIVSEAIPIFICLPAFFLLADDCYRLCALASSRKSDFSSAIKRVGILKHCLVAILSIAINHLYCAYIIPLLT